MGPDERNGPEAHSPLPLLWGRTLPGHHVPHRHPSKDPLPRHQPNHPLRLHQHAQSARLLPALRLRRKGSHMQYVLQRMANSFIRSFGIFL